MSNNSSSSSSSSSIHSYPRYIYSNCFGNRLSNIIFSGVTATNVLFVLPLLLLMVHVAQQRWRRRQSLAKCHCDAIAYNMAAMETIYMLSSGLYCAGIFLRNHSLIIATSHGFYASSCGQMLFHLLTCVERYLAVVHPVTYMKASAASRVRVPNGATLCIWLHSAVLMSTIARGNIDFIIVIYFTEQVLSLLLISSCSFAVLAVLRRPGPGGRDRVDRSKQRAANTIMAVMAALLLRSFGCLACNTVYAVPSVALDVRCLVIDSSYWFCVPSALVLPLLFLHRAGKLPCCRGNTETGPGSA